MKQDTREIISEIRALLDAMDLKAIDQHPEASYFAKQAAKQDLFLDHRQVTRQVANRQEWR